MQHTIPYTPQQNGVVEIKNHTLKEMANCMLQAKGPGLQYWDESFNCAYYIVSHTPTKGLKDITPEEVWSIINQMLAIFVCLVVKHGLTFRMKNGKYCSLQVKSAYLLDIHKM